jgi:hypothetical protein
MCRNQKKNKRTGIFLILLSSLTFFIGLPIYAYQVNLYGGAWCDAIDRMAMYIGIPALLLFLIGIYLLLKKWWIPLVFAIPVIFMGFGWYAFTTVVIGVFITGKGW